MFLFGSIHAFAEIENLEHIYRNNMNNRFLTASALLRNSRPHSSLVLEQWSLAPDGNFEAPPCHKSDSSSCFGIEIQLSNTEPLFVSLGSHCRPAHMLRYCGLRKMAFPFDWIVSLNGEALIEMLEEDFLHFFYPPAFFPFGPASHLFQSYYQLEFLHEGDFGGEQFFSNMEKLQTKYLRRIERFRQLGAYKGRLFFLREAYEGSLNDPHRYYRCAENIEISEEYALRLYEVLQRKFPDLDFCLLIINHHAASHMEIEKKLSPHLFMVRANPSKASDALEAQIRAYAHFFKQVLEEER